MSLVTLSTVTVSPVLGGWESHSHSSKEVRGKECRTADQELTHKSSSEVKCDTFSNAEMKLFPKSNVLSFT